MKKTMIELPDEIHKQLKIYCIQNGVPMRDYLRNIVIKEFETKKE